MSSQRITLSFYRYQKLDHPELVREQLYTAWSAMGVLGRTYLAHEGINAQIAVPQEHFVAFREHVDQFFPAVPFKIAIEENKESFYKLTVKVRPKLVADGLNEELFDASDVGEHLDAESFHQAMAQEGTIVVDLRNSYECEVGKFEGALTPDGLTFREVLPEMLEKLKGKEDAQIILYCTGGIRCEKASAYFRFRGFKQVAQLHGGIIDYVRQVRSKGLDSQFKGKNFVFDQRLGERVTDDVLSLCHQCDQPCDEHVNCLFEGCNRLFIQCPSCQERMERCCSKECQEIMQEPKEERVRIQQEWERVRGPHFYFGRRHLKKSHPMLTPQ